MSLVSSKAFRISIGQRPSNERQDSRLIRDYCQHGNNLEGFTLGIMYLLVEEIRLIRLVHNSSVPFVVLLRRFCLPVAVPSIDFKISLISPHILLCARPYRTEHVIDPASKDLPRLSSENVTSQSMNRSSRRSSSVHKSSSPAPPTSAASALSDVISKSLRKCKWVMMMWSCHQASLTSSMSVPRRAVLFVSRFQEVLVGVQTVIHNKT